ncbi:MAG: hypothetical protein EZS28_033689, partial [Streblomastix strix]
VDNKVVCLTAWFDAWNEKRMTKTTDKDFYWSNSKYKKSFSPEQCSKEVHVVMSDACNDKKRSVTTIRKVAIYLMQNKDKIKIEIDRRKGQWIVGIMLSQGPTAQQFSICQSPDYATANRGLRITTDGNTLIFNGNGVVDTGTDQTITSIKTFEKVVQINPIGDNFNEGLRISRSANSDYCGIYLCCNPQSTTGALADQLSMVNTPTGELRIGVNTQINQNLGLMISADGNTLNFYGKMNSGNIQINPSTTEYDYGLRISRTIENTGGSSIFL